MSLRDLFRRRTPPAATAKARLHFVLLHERAGHDAPDFLPRLQDDILKAIRRYVVVSDDMVSLRMSHLHGSSRLELNIDLPEAAARLSRR